MRDAGPLITPCCFTKEGKIGLEQALAHSDSTNNLRLKIEMEGLKGREAMERLFEETEPEQEKLCESEAVVSAADEPEEERSEADFLGWLDAPFPSDLRRELVLRRSQ